MIWPEIKKINSDFSKPLDTLITEKAAEIMDISTTGVGQTVFSYATEIPVSETTDTTRLVAKFIAPKDGVYKYTFQAKRGATSGTQTMKIYNSVTSAYSYMTFSIPRTVDADASAVIFYSFTPDTTYATYTTYLSLKKGDVCLITDTGTNYQYVQNQVITCDS